MPSVFGYIPSGSRYGNVPNELIHRAGRPFLDNHYRGYQYFMKTITWGAVYCNELKFMELLWSSFPPGITFLLIGYVFENNNTCWKTLLHNAMNTRNVNILYLQEHTQNKGQDTNRVYVCIIITV